MRYAIVSDIHANWAAWKTVLTDIADLKADKIICLGDVAGYGPNPVEVLESVYRVVNVTLMGNHDAAACGKLDPSTFSPRARTAVLRHREQLSQAGISWLSALPLVLTAPTFRCAHGDFSDPVSFRYIIEPVDALPSWKATREQLLFVGHSHLPGIYVIGAKGIPHFVEPRDFTLEDGKRYIVNPGSVGYPRVGDCRSSYCLFDDVARTIIFRQLPFDRAGYRRALREAGLGSDAWIQDTDTRQRLPRVREYLSFGKKRLGSQHVQDLNEYARFSPSPVNRKKTLLFFAAALAGASLAAGLTAFVAGRKADSAALALTVPDFDLPALNAYPLIPRDKNLLPGLPDTFDASGRMPGWRYAFENRSQQTFGTGLCDGAITLRIRNAGPHKAQLESPLITLTGTTLRALRMQGQIRKPETFSGTVFYQLISYTTQPDGTQLPYKTESYEVRDVRRKASPPAAAVSRKIEISKRITHVRFRIEADFSGTLEIEQPTLTDAADSPAPPAATNR